MLDTKITDFLLLATTNLLVKVVFNFIGRNFPRHDGFAKASGLAEFTFDIEVPGMLYGRIFKSPYAFAKVSKIHTSLAEAMGAVVLTPDDAPDTLFNPRLLSVEEDTFKDWRVLTREPRYVGEPIAAVAASTEEGAQRALEALRVEFEEIYEPLLDPFKSSSPGARHIRDRIMRGRRWVEIRNNIAAEFKYSEGDLETEEKRSDVLVEKKFHASRRYHAQLEPKGAVCKIEPDGSLTVWTTTQTIHNTKILISQVYGIPMHKVDVRKVPLGGGFGSSIHTNLVTLIAVGLCLKSRKPVKLVLTREDDMVHDHTGFEFYMRVRAGATRGGMVTFGELENTVDIGAHQVQAYPLLGACLGWFVSLYRWRALRYYGRAVYTNKVPSCAIRGYGAPEVTWAVETVVDELAEELKIDPLEFRLANYRGKGEIFWGQGPTVRSIIRSDGVPELATKCSELIGWKNRGDPKTKTGRFRRGIGVGRGFHTSGAGGPLSGAVIDYSGAFIKVNEDGTVNYVTALQDHGGGTLDAHAKIIAEELKIPPSKIRIVWSGTSTTVYDVCTHASRGVFVGGEAARRAAVEVKQKILEYAARILDAVSPEALRIEYDKELDDAVIFVEGAPDRRVSLSEVVKTAWQRNWGSVSASVSYRATVAPPSFTVYFVEVEVDTETGIVKPIRVVAGADIGTVISPELAAGQIHGGFAIGWSWTVGDEVAFLEDGAPAHRLSLADYKLPTILDLPSDENFKVVFASTYEPYGPFGAKGLGEAASNPVIAAVASAIYNAIGVRFYEIPVTPEKILKAIKGGD